MLRYLIAGLSIGCLGPVAAARAAPIAVVAAENMYGDVAAQVGGADVAVTSILANPDQDPHLFEASPAIARAVAGAALAIENGAAYDPWMESLLGASASAGRRVIDVAALAGRKPGDNPHLWYDPAIVARFAHALATALAQRDPAHAATYAGRAQAFDASLAPLRARMALLRARFAGAPVTATEPVFGLMAQALGLSMRNQRFQVAVMNNAEPRASDVAAFEDDLRQRRVRVLVYNAQASDPAAERLLRIARQARVPVVGVSETEPAGKTYQGWMLGQLDALERALAQGGT